VSFLPEIGGRKKKIKLMRIENSELKTLVPDDHLTLNAYRQQNSQNEDKY
jgi:hypothetical protein